MIDTRKSGHSIKKEAENLGKKLRTLFVLLALLALFTAMAASGAAAFEKMSPDGKTCTPCHTDGRTAGGAANPAAPAQPAAQPAKTSAPAEKAAPAVKAAPAPVKLVSTVSISAFGKTTKFEGTVVNNVVLLPLRPVADFYGAVLDWDNKTKSAKVFFNGKQSVLPVGKTSATVDGKEVKLEAASRLVKGQALVPASFVAELFSSAASGDAKAGIAINAGLAGYAGSSACGKCHASAYADWKGTRHARMLQDAKDPNAWWISDFSINTFFKKEEVDFIVGNGMEGGQRYVTFKDGRLQYLPATWNAEQHKWVKGAWSSYSCGTCHATGYNAKNNSWVENGITCESCHGPGAAHAKAPSKTNIKSNLTNDMCASCHGGDRQAGQMDEAAKANANGSHLGIFKAASTAEAARYWTSGCFRCHSAAYKVAQAKGKPLPVADDFTKGALKDDRVGITCMVCHDPHKNTGQEFQLRKDPMETCLQCHQSSSAIKTGSAPHHPQKESFAGYIFKGDGTTQMVPFPKAGATCADCHMANGNHLFKVGTPKITLLSHGRPVEVDACAKCHEDMTKEKIEGIQEEFEARYEALKAVLDALKASPNAAKVKAYTDAATTNLGLFEADASKGIHNTTWAEAMFASVEKDLATAQDLVK